jgi:hypothetical protein
MGYVDIQTTMIYAHHIPKASAAAELTALVAVAAGAEALSPAGVIADASA